MNAPRLLQTISGDFKITTKVDINPRYNYQGAGLLVWRDFYNYVSVQRTLVKGVNMGYRINGIYGAIEIPYSISPVYLQINHSGSRFTGSYSQDGFNWINVSTVELPMATTLQAGLLLINQWQDNPISADFDFFEVGDCGW